MSKISKRMSDILGFQIREGEWDRYLEDMNKEGEPTRKHMAELIFAVCEEFENLRKDLDAVMLKEEPHVTGKKAKSDTN